MKKIITEKNLRNLQKRQKKVNKIYRIDKKVYITTKNKKLFEFGKDIRRTFEGMNKKTKDRTVRKIDRKTAVMEQNEKMYTLQN